MSGLSHTPGKRARGQTLRGFESRLIRQKNKIPAAPKALRGFFIDGTYLVFWTIFMADAIKVDTSLILPGMISVVVASAATRP